MSKFFSIVTKNSSDQELLFYSQPVQNISLTQESYYTIKRVMLEHKTGVRHPIPITDRSVKQTYKLEDILEAPEFSNINIKFKMDVAGLTELTLLYKFTDSTPLSESSNKIISLEEFFQMTGMMPSRYFSYYQALNNCPTYEIRKTFFIGKEVYRKYSELNPEITFGTAIKVSPHMEYIYLLDQPIEKGNFAFSRIMLPSLPEAVFINVEAFKYFNLANSLCCKFNIGDRKILHIENLFLRGNIQLKELPNVKYEGLKQVYIENCPALTKLPDDFYNNLNLKITIKDCSNLVVKANSNITFL